MSLSKEPIDPQKLCPDCHEVYKKPRLLRCLHVLCEQSILDMLEDARLNKTTPKCPICKSEAGIIDLYELPPMGLVETDGADDDDSIIEECIICEQAGIHHCTTCNIHLCLVHADEHVQKKSTHQIIHTVARSKEISQCRMHARQEYTKYCMTCLEIVCNHCIKAGHRKHTLLTLDEAFEKLRDMVSNRPDKINYFRQFEKQVESAFSEVITKLQQCRGQLRAE